jgi:hypothetical protein
MDKFDVVMTVKLEVEATDSREAIRLAQEDFLSMSLGDLLPAITKIFLFKQPDNNRQQ